MNLLSKLVLFVLSSLLLLSCGGTQESNSKQANMQNEDNETVLPGSASSQVDTASSPGLILSSQPFNTTILTDADGDINSSYYTSLYNSKLGLNGFLDFHYHRVGCSSDTCKQEFITLAAVEYPQDSLLQRWMADILAHFYYDATRALDIKVNGGVSSDNGDGESILLNTGCAAYEGSLGNQGKELFNYYQTRLWLVGKKREADQHGPSGRYLCTVYQCWQTTELSSWFVAYSTDDPVAPAHYVTSFSRHTGSQLTLTDVIMEDNMAEFNELLADAAHGRYLVLSQSKSGRIAVEENADDYSSSIQINQIGFTQDGLAISTGALPFDQWPSATHILILPYAKVNAFLQPNYRK